MRPGDRDKLGRPYGFKPKSCRVCGKEFQPVTGFNKYCSPACAAEGQMVTRACKRCGESFRAVRSAPKAYCSGPCAKKGGGETRKKNDWKRVIVCPGCNQKFTRTNARVKTCSHSCATKVQHERRRKTLGSPPRWGCRGKGERNCRNCGRRATHLHHIVPRSKTKLGHRDMRNGLPLCRDCHYGWHHQTVAIFSDRLTTEERRFATELTSEWWVETRYPPRPYDPANIELSNEEQAQLVDDCGGIEIAYPPEVRS